MSHDGELFIVASQDPVPMEPHMKLARVISVFVNSAAVVTFAVTGSELQAADRIKIQVAVARSAPTHVATSAYSYTYRKRQSSSLSYTLPIKVAADRHMDLMSDRTRKFPGIAGAADAKIEMSPRVANWSENVTKSGVFNSRHFNVQSVPVKVFGRRFILSRFNFNRNRIQARITAVF